jgi:hypothetical protein
MTAIETMLTITEQDLCAECVNCSLMQWVRKDGTTWDAKAICAGGWPFTGWCIEANCVSACHQFEKAERRTSA